MHLKPSTLPMLMLIASITATAVAEEDVAAKTESTAKDVTLTGTFEAVESSELAAKAEHLKSLVIKRIVAHGTTIKAGQVVAAFETEDADEKIKAAEVDLQLAKITMQEDEAAYAQFKATQLLDRAAAERSWKQARQTFDNFQETDRDRSILSAEFSQKSSEQALDNAMEELQQLEQMYQEDELTEESEEIVLKRAKQAVESAEFRLEGTKVQTKRTIRQSVPLQTEQQKEALDRAEMAHHKTLQSLQFAAARQKIEFVKKRDDINKQEREFKELTAERKHLVITAPHDAIVFHGKLSRGKLSDKASTTEAGTPVTHDQILVTLVNPAKLQIRTELTETQLNQVTAGEQGTANPAALASQQLNIKVKSIDRVPYANNKFDCIIAISNRNVANIVPGTSCSITLPAAR